jgi:transposase
MDDSHCQDFFRQPTHAGHRRYEALRAVFVDGRSQKEVAEEFGVGYSCLRQWVYDLRQHCRHGAAESPFFKTRKLDARPQSRRCLRPRRPRPQSPQWRTAVSYCCRRPSLCA